MNPALAEKDRLRPGLETCSEMPKKWASPKAKSEHVFGQGRKPAKMFRAGLYARVSTNDQQTLAMQNLAMREYAARRGWTIALHQVTRRELRSGKAGGA